MADHDMLASGTQAERRSRFQDQMSTGFYMHLLAGLDYQRLVRVGMAIGNVQVVVGFYLDRAIGRDGPGPVGFC